MFGRGNICFNCYEPTPFLLDYLDGTDLDTIKRWIAIVDEKGYITAEEEESE